MAPRLRVIAGTLGGRRLSAPAGIRPTTDRVREAVFASLGTRVADAAVLDLYAGSGAFAIEALSRGAARAVLVDADRAAAEICRENLVTTGLGARARVREQTVARFLASGPPPEAPFDLVGCDPPYDTPDVEVRSALTTLAALASPGWLALDVRVVVERAAPGRSASGEGAPRWPAPWRIVWERTYGGTLVHALEIVRGE
jgi:16S rRNA (guanine966-N2)-methyltransferase